jgi:hypothetical protein
MVVELHFGRCPAEQLQNALSTGFASNPSSTTSSGGKSARVFTIELRNFASED